MFLSLDCPFVETKNKNQILSNLPNCMPNSIDFYKRIFLHVTPVCIIVPWSEVVMPSETKWDRLKRTDRSVRDVQVILKSLTLDEKLSLLP